MSAHESPFHAYDIRGRLGQDFTLDDILRYGYYIAKEFAPGGCVGVGRDVRATSSQLYEYFVRGVHSAGCDVLDFGICTTPQLYFSHWKENAECSVMITASHNPPEYNGFKLTGTGCEPIGYDNGLNKIELLAQKPITAQESEGSKLYKKDLRADYINYLRTFAGDRTGLRFAVDCMHGVVGTLIHNLLPDAALYLNDTPDGAFLPTGPNPTIAENRKALHEAVIQNHYDVGLIFDGDGDRVMFLDEAGELVPPDLIIALLGDYYYHTCKRDSKQPVLVDIRTSKSTTEYLKELGVSVEVGRVGRVFMSRKLREIQGLFGGELAGHYYFGDFQNFDSGLLTALLVLSVVRNMKAQGSSLHAWVTKNTRYQNSGEINFQVPAERKSAILSAVYNHFTQEATPIFVSDADGYRVEFTDWWFSVRSSNTEPLLRLIVEARDKELLTKRVEEATQIIKSI